MALRAPLEPSYGSAVPTFVLGPLYVRGQFADGNFRIPFATTERRLPESLQRVRLST